MPRAWPLFVTPLSSAACGSVVWRSGGAVGVTIVVKATYGLVNDGQMKQIAPLEIVCEDRHHAPGGSLAEAMEIAPYLPNAGVVLTGHACAPGGRPVPSMAVRMALFRDEKLLNKALHVTGDRAHASAAPQPFLKLPLVYERAYGGPAAQDNPAGIGTDLASRPANVVSAGAPPGPPGFGPIAGAWPARAQFLGGLDRRALQEPVAEIPQGFDWRYFQAAPRDQQIDALLGGDWLVLDGLHADVPHLQTRLPSVRAQARWHLLSASGAGPAHEVELRADTLVVDADRMVGSLIWRGSFKLDRLDQLSWVRAFAGIERPEEPIRWPGADAVAGAGPASTPAPASTPTPPSVPPPSAPAPPSAPVPLPAPAPIAPPPAPSALPPVVKAPAALTITAGLDATPAPRSLPFVAPDPTQRSFEKALDEHPRPPVVRPPAALTGTGPMDLHKIVSAILPFASGGGDVRAPVTVEPPPPPRSRPWRIPRRLPSSRQSRSGGPRPPRPRPRRIPRRPRRLRGPRAPRSRLPWPRHLRTKARPACAAPCWRGSATGSRSTI